MDMKLFVNDEIKYLLFMLVFGSPIFYIIMLVIEWGGDLFFIWLLVATLLIIVVFKYLYLNIIMPSFNKFVELKSYEGVDNKEDLIKVI
jgi:STE24 endopeptidase